MKNHQHQTTQHLWGYFLSVQWTNPCGSWRCDRSLASSRLTRRREWWFLERLAMTWAVYFGKMMVPSFLEQNWLKEKWKWLTPSTNLGGTSHQKPWETLCFLHITHFYPLVSPEHDPRCWSVWGWKHRLGMAQFVGNFTDHLWMDMGRTYRHLWYSDIFFKGFIHIHNIPQLTILYQPNFVRVALRLDRHIRGFLHIPSHSFTFLHIPSHSFTISTLQETDEWSTPLRVHQTD